ncbi:Alpha/Beta hydrolase protein [Geopyxis carbonaria]|nr:Alpha/Beta hydrolase protein [Geopyxis carbonaria]
MTSLLPIDPYDDPRITHEYAMLNGRRYHYVQGFPKHQKPRGTIICIHGFPDIWYSWRGIIPALLEMGLRVIAPDMIGYGQTDMPKVPPNTMAAYSWKSSAADMAELMKQLEIPKVILLGHDWGGMIVFRIHMWHPGLVSHIITLSTAYRPPIREKLTLEQIVEKTPTFVYQIGFADPQTEKDLESNEAIARFLRAVHRIRGDPGTGTLQVRKDIMKNLGDQAIPKQWNEKVYSYYIEEYTRRGMHGPLNWYKLTEQNYSDEKEMKCGDKINIPVMFIGATRDIATPASMGASQAQFIDNLTYHELNTGHWIHIEEPARVIDLLTDFVENVVFRHKAKL